MKRKTISKGKRFEIFKRDGFTCRYCGSKPPDIVLEVDHILPVSEGGDNEDMNLVAACYPCNRGKGKKILNKPQRPDAELEWLELQQEIAELERYNRVKLEKSQVISTTINELQCIWCDVSGLDWHPSDHVVRRMLDKYPPELIEEAFVATSIKVDGGYIPDKDWLPYCYGVLRNMDEEK